MKKQFEKFRRCQHWAIVLCVVQLSFCIGLEVYRRQHPEVVFEHWFRRGLSGLLISESSVLIVVSLLMWRYAKCPYCGRSVIPWWGSFARVSRIMKRKPVLCAHCGEEVETDGMT